MLTVFLIFSIECHIKIRETKENGGNKLLRFSSINMLKYRLSLAFKEL